MFLCSRKGQKDAVTSSSHCRWWGCGEARPRAGVSRFIRRKRKGRSDGGSSHNLAFQRFTAGGDGALER